MPMNPEERQMADKGKPVVVENKEPDLSIKISGIVKKIDEMLRT